ncbi:Chromosome transmission fidelity protein 18 [Coemansia sp. S16]|nr:Chromosome transmission fidelity protein 18 [Coemansia sp. S16]
MPMRYPVRQLISQELERLRLARLAAKSLHVDEAVDAKELSKRDYLTKLFADPMASSATAKPLKRIDGSEGEEEPVVKDFFGRIITKKKPVATSGSPVKGAKKTSIPTERSREWFHFFEGFSNAVRKPTQVKELL